MVVLLKRCRALSQSVRANAARITLTQAYSQTTVDPEEIGRFKKLAGTWSDSRGPFHLLHKMTLLRVEYIRQQWGRHRSLKGLRVLDVGTGGGLLALPLARLGASVVAIDACRENVEAAKMIHSPAIARESLDLRFIALPVESLPNAEQYDMVLASEVLEHVADPPSFLHECALRVAPGGMLFLSTINKGTLSNLLVVKVAEQLLNLVPLGTHDPRKFISPQQIEQIVSRRLGPAYKLGGIQGVAYVPFLDNWYRIPSSSVNYFATIKKGL